MWAEAGILSLAFNDTKFQGNSDYWTGPIWVNFQYLLLRAIHKYYPNNGQGEIVAKSLWPDFVGNMLKDFNDTGYIWEHYNWTTKNGEGNHPFTGWSTLITLIITEDWE